MNGFDLHGVDERDGVLPLAAGGARFDHSREGHDVRGNTRGLHVAEKFEGLRLRPLLGACGDRISVGPCTGAEAAPAHVIEELEGAIP